jgi:chlorite dismutase
MRPQKGKFVSYAAAREIASDAGCRDLEWGVSFVVHCTDVADARQTMEALRENPVTRSMFYDGRHGPAKDKKRRNER